MSRNEVPEKRTMVCRDEDSGTELTYYFEKGVLVRTDIKYLSGYTSAEEELAKMNKGLPKTKRKYLDEENKVISYLTAKKKGLI